MAVVDAFIFRAVVPAAQTAMVGTTGALQRIALFAPLAVLDEIAFRLLLMSAFLWLLTYSTALSSGTLRYWIAIIAVALAYLPLHWSYLASLGPPTPMLVAREIALHITAGILWGWLYWRYGLASAMIAHASAHLTLQPLLGRFFS
jgi:hypothetical protein